MTANQFFLEEASLSVGEEYSLSEGDSHHANAVLRLRVGDTVRIAGRHSGSLFFATVSRLPTRHDGRVSVTLTEEIVGEGHSPAVQELIFAICKGKKNELAVEKATELGVERVVFWQTERSIAKLDNGTKRERLQKTAETAAKQCKRPSIPEILVFSDRERLAEHLKIHERTERISCSLSKNAVPVSSHQWDLTKRVTIAIGPEGDFSPKEEDWLAENDFQLVSLGGNILRSETAAIASIAVVNALRGMHSS
ncbi:16S rRNA (uracil(1498)-N(3))-methyltransferase [bacterium]|nr:16S rRNA (uracil(1498)-N(3))-methyltransferase [bacterium]